MRLIDADARVTVQSFDEEHEEYNLTEMSVEEALDFATDEGCPPVVDAVPVVHGHWTTKRSLTHDGEWYCSNCEYEPTVFEDYKYCPNCGAKMDEKKG